MVVILVLVLIWAAVLLPPAVRLHQARRDAFLCSFERPVEAPRPRSTQVQRRRRIAGGLLVAMAATLLAGLLPTFRVLLVVHLFLVDSFIAYIALLAHMANRAARRDVLTAEVPAAVDVAPSRRWRRAAGPRPVVVPAG